MKLLWNLQKWLQNRRNINMVAIYVRRILEGKMTLEEVPEKWRAQVEEKLNEN